MDTRYLTDTNVIIHFLGGIFNETANEWLETIGIFKMNVVNLRI